MRGPYFGREETEGMSDMKELEKKSYERFVELLLRYCMAERPGENLIISPMSVLTLAGMAAEATAGETRDELLNMLGIEGSEEHVLPEGIRTLLEDSRKLSSANAVCVDQSLSGKIRPDFAEKLKEHFDGEVFAAEDLVHAVNGWVKEKTNGLIDRILDDSSRVTKLCLLSALAFDAAWEDTYEDWDVYDTDFHNADGTVVNVAIMQSLENSYIDDDRFTGVVKPYEDDQYSFVALLPKEEGPIDEQTLEGLDISDLMSRSENIQADTYIPEFVSSYDGDLSGFFRAMKVHTVFTEQADFSPMTPEWLRADKILHKAVMEVDTKGSRAAAVTSMEVVAACAPLGPRREVILNRPFIYAVVHNQTGLPVFVGVMNSMKESHAADRHTVFREKRPLRRSSYHPESYRITITEVSKAGFVKVARALGINVVELKRQADRGMAIEKEGINYSTAVRLAKILDECGAEYDMWPKLQ